MDKEFELLKEFERSLKEDNRYFINDTIKNALEHIIEDKTVHIRKNKTFFRGRVLDRDRKIPFEIDQMGIPPKHVKTQGRFNSVGINHLYLATDIETVVAELRPNLNSHICIGEFKTNDKMKIVNLSDDFAIADYSPKINISSLTLLLGALFAVPISQAEQNLDYLPMQYFAELCKSKDIEGILYFSSLFMRNPKKCNLTLFNEDKVDCIKTKLIRVNSITYSYKNAKTPLNSASAARVSG